MTAPKDPQLYAVRVNGTISFAVAARTEREAEKHVLANSIKVERVKPAESHMLGMNGVPVQYARPEYQPEDLFPPPRTFPLIGDGLAFDDAAVADVTRGAPHPPAGGPPANTE